MESAQVTSLASIGLALHAASPALVHAIRGSLHDVTMLTALLQPTSMSPASGDNARLKAEQRLRDIGNQLQMLERNVALLAAMTQWPSCDSQSMCATSNALPDVVRLLQDEAARQRIRLECDFVGLPPHLHADQRALQHALLACGAWAAQHVGERATLRISGREEAGEAIFEFEAPGLASEAGRIDDSELQLLAALVQAAGGRLGPTRPLQLAFRRASGRAAA